MKDDKAIKLRYYPKNPKNQGEIIAKVNELVKMRHNLLEEPVDLAHSSGEE